MDKFATRGLFEQVKYLSENQNVVCTTDAIDRAARNGHFEIVKYLSENRTEGCTTRAMDRAAQRGHFEIVKYLAENRNENAIDLAANYRHLKIVKYLAENRNEGCTSNAIDLAAKNGNFEIVKYLAENRNEGYSESTFHSAVAKAVIGRNFQIVKSLLNCKSCLQRSRSYLVQNFEAVKILHELDDDAVLYGSLPKSALDFAISQYDLKYIKCLYTHKDKELTKSDWISAWLQISN